MKTTKGTRTTKREARLVRAGRLALDRLESLVETTEAEDYGSGPEAEEVVERDWSAVEALRRALGSYDRMRRPGAR